MQSHRWMSSCRVRFEPAIKAEHFSSDGIRARFAPLRSLLKSLFQAFIFANNRQVVQRRKIPAFRACFKLIRDSRSAENYRLASLANILCQPQPDIAIFLIVDLPAPLAPVIMNNGWWRNGWAYWQDGQMANGPAGSIVFSTQYPPHCG